MNVVSLLVILSILFAFFFLWHALTRKQGEKWLRDEGYLPPTQEEAEQARREAMYGKLRGGE
jgi:hypothetical protein